MKASADALNALLDAVQAEPYAHDFFALLRRIESASPGMPRWGEAMRPSQEPIRLGQEPELDFAPAAIAVLDRAGSGPPRLGVRFFGLLGPQGPMPLHLTEYARERIQHRSDPTLARFLDVFHHRMLALFYRAWAQNQPTVQHDRPAEDRFAAWLGASFGQVRQHGAAARHDDRARLFHAGALASRSRHPEGLTKLLTSHFKVPVQVESHRPHRMPIAESDRSRLGQARNRPRAAIGFAAQLGASATAGSKVHDRQFKFRIRLGPMALADYIAFLPGQPAANDLRSWVRQAVGLDLLWDVQLCLARDHVPPPALASGVRLGVSTWLGRSRQRPRAHDPADFHFSPESPSTRRSPQGASHG